MRLTRGRDDASSASIGLVVAVVLLMAGFMTAQSMVERPPGTDPRGPAYASAASTALELLVRDPGLTTTGAAWALDADHLSRMGLALAGQPNFIDYAKIKSLRNGTLVADGTNNAPDYPEVKAALGIPAADLHLRTYPVMAGVDDPRWTKDPQGRVAYFAHYSGASSPVAITTSAVKTTATLNVSVTLQNTGAMDAIYTTSFHLGNVASQTDLVDGDDRHTILLPSGGSQTVWVNFDQMTPWSSSITGVHVLVTDGYGNVALDATGAQVGDLWVAQTPPSGSANAYGLTVTAQQPYFVSGATLNFDADDYDAAGAHVSGVGARFVLVGPDAKEWANYTFTFNNTKKSYEWTHACPNCTAAGDYTAIVWNSAMTRSAQDVAHVSAAQMFTDKNTLDPKAQKEAVLLQGLVTHFNPTRYDAATNPEGDIFGDDSNGPTDLVDLLSRYTHLVVGSEVAQNALEPSKTKNGIADWVQAGGNLVVLGTYSSQSHWLEAIYHAAQTNANGGIGAPDPTHPILTAPEKLNYQSYLDRGRAWSIKNDQPFTHVLTRGSSGTNIDDTLAVANPGSLGNGTVVLTSYMPGSLTSPQDDLEAKRLMHNLLSQGYTMLFLDYGPPIPPGVPVGSAARLVAVPHPNVPGAVVEVRLVMYVFG